MKKITFLLALLFTFVGVVPSMATDDLVLDESKVYTIKFTTNLGKEAYIYAENSYVTYDTSVGYNQENEATHFKFVLAPQSGDGHKVYYIKSVSTEKYLFRRSDSNGYTATLVDGYTSDKQRWIVLKDGDTHKIMWAKSTGGVYYETTYFLNPSEMGSPVTISDGSFKTLTIEAIDGSEVGGGESGGGESEESNTKNAPTNVTVSQAPTVDGWDVNTKFYTIKNGNFKCLSGDNIKSGTNYLSLDKSSTPDESGYWCITGNDTEGYSFYNYETGKILAMSANTSDESNAFAWLEDPNSAADYKTKFTFVKSKKTGDYWCVKVKDSENSYWTQHGNNTYNSYNCLSYWNSEMAVNGWNNSGLGDDGSSFIFEAVNVNLPLNVNLAEITADDQLLSNMEGRIGTFSAPYATTIPSGVTAYYAQPSEVNGTDVISLKALGEGVVPANFGVLLVGSAERVTMNPNKTSVEVPENAFSHSAGADVTLPENSYILVRGDLGIGFYPAKVGSTLKANKTYLNLGTSNVSAFKLMVDEVTAIESVVTGKTNSAIYDLSGRRVLNTVKGGIYIQNGKKFIVK